jgi:hypothetical protein
MIASGSGQIKGHACVQDILERAARRYIQLPRTERPSLRPQNIEALFSTDDLNVLWRAGRWPLRPEDMAVLVELTKQPTATPSVGRDLQTGDHEAAPLPPGIVLLAEAVDEVLGRLARRTA